MAARNSEIRAYLLRYAERNKIRIKEYVSDWREGPIEFYCHLEGAAGSATALSLEGHDNALVMAFLSFSNPAISFVD